MATWIDLSAHNLALWRVGEDKSGERRYLLLPIFDDVDHTRPDPQSVVGTHFSWNAAVGGYVLNLRYAETRLPAKDFWLEQFPGALFRDRDTVTFPIHQPALLDLRVLPLRNPWVWSNQENPERFYANEDQSLADGAGHSVLRSAEEVDARGVSELVFPVESGAMEAAELDLVESGASPSDSYALSVGIADTAYIGVLAVENNDSSLSPSVATSSPTQETLSAPLMEVETFLDIQPSSAQRLDYGDVIPGARKTLWEGVQADIDLQTKLQETTGRLDANALQALSGRSRRDAIWGTLKDRLEQPDVAASPLKQALWAWAYREIPASVKSSYWEKAKRSKGAIPPENLYLRIVAYPEILRSIERRINSIDEGLSVHDTADQLIGVLTGDFRQGRPVDADVFTDLYPSGAYDRLPDVLRDRALFIFPVSMAAYAELLDHPSYGLNDLVASMRKDSSSRLLGDMISFLQEKGMDAITPEHRDALAQSLHASFLEMIPDIVVKDAVHERKYCEKTLSERGRDNYFFNLVVRRIGDLVGKESSEALESGDASRITSVLDRYIEAYSREKVDAFIKKSTLVDAMQSSMKTVLCEADGDASLYADPAHKAYQIVKDEDRALAVSSLEKVVKQLMLADQFRVEHALQTAQTSQSAQDDLPSAQDLQTEEGDGAEAKPAFVDTEPSGETMENTETTGSTNSYTPPSFIRWNPRAKPLPPERSESEGYRTGPDAIRGDQDVTEEALCERFGLRGIQYGNWMTQKDRQEHLNAAFDGLQDIQAVIGLDDPRSVGLPRKTPDGDGTLRQPLALALGARGRGGRAAAHYEPSLHVINMTKTKGAGCLLHEWTHAADWLLGAELSQGATTPASRIPGNLVSEHLQTLKSAVKDTNKAERRQSVVEKARDMVVPIISNTMISKNIQEYMESSLRYYFIRVYQKELMDCFEEEYRKVKRGEMTPEERTVSKEDVEARSQLGRMKGIAAFEEALPKMLAATDKLLARLDLAMSPENMGQEPLSNVSEKVLVEPVYQYETGRRTMHFNALTAANWLRELLDLPAFSDDDARQAMEKRVHEKDPTVSDADVVAQIWSDAVFPGFWKKMANKIVNKNPYTQVARETAGQSQFFAQALTLDGKKLAQGEAYWSSDVELLARSVASIGYDKLQSLGIENTYLTDAVPGRYSGPQYRADSEPQEKERTAFAQDFFERVCPNLREVISEATEEYYVDRLPNEEAARIAAEDQGDALAKTLEYVEGRR